MALSERILLQLKEKVEVLTGERGNGRNAALLRANLIEVQEQIARLRKGSADLTQAIERVSQSMQSITGDLDDVGRELEAAKQELEQLLDNMPSFEQELEQLRTDLGNAEDAITGVEQQQSSLGQRVSSVEDKLGEASSVTVPAIDAAPVTQVTASDFNALRSGVRSLAQAVETLAQSLN